MSKYIDADLLRKEIERQRQFIEELFTEGDNSFYDGQDDAYCYILAFLDFLDSIQEQPVEGLEEEYEQFAKSDHHQHQILLGKGGIDLARHFAEWGASHAATPHYFELRELKTGRVFLAEWSDIAGEWYERGNGKAYQSDEVEIVQHAKK